MPPEQIPPFYRTAYQVCVRRGWRPESAEVYRIPLRERLPIIKIPLRERDDDVFLDLQEMVNHAYIEGEYDDEVDYKADPDPPLSPADAKWAAKLLREKRLR